MAYSPFGGIPAAAAGFPHLQDGYMPSAVSSVSSDPVQPAAVYANDDLSNRINGIYDYAALNSAMNMESARQQMAFQEASQNSAMLFNAAEAAKNRKWQEYMSNTAHQREVQDLLAAGLNPILSAMNGNGASVGSGASASISGMSGASASADTSASGAVANLIATVLKNETDRRNADVSAMTSLANTEKTVAANKEIQRQYYEAMKEVARIQQETSFGTAHISGHYGNAGAAISAGGQIAAAAQSAGAVLGAAAINANSAAQLQASAQAHDITMARDYSGNPFQMASGLATDLGFNGVGGAIGSLIKEVGSAASNIDSYGQGYNSSGNSRGTTKNKSGVSHAKGGF